MIALRTTCPQEIAASNHHIKTQSIWKDPKYRQIEKEFIRDNPKCDYCGQPSKLAHHNESWMYKRKEEYYKKENMTPVCGKCHMMYRKGFIICPKCKIHYTRATNDCCAYCSGKRSISKDGTKNYNRKRMHHPCERRFRLQVCMMNGRKRLCAYGSKRAELCRDFVRKVEDKQQPPAGQRGGR